MTKLFFRLCEAEGFVDFVPFAFVADERSNICLLYTSIVCARLVGCVKDRLNPALVADGDIMKIDHKNPSFFCSVSLI